MGKIEPLLHSAMNENARMINSSWCIILRLSNSILHMMQYFPITSNMSIQDMTYSIGALHECYIDG